MTHRLSNERIAGIWKVQAEAEIAATTPQAEATEQAETETEEEQVEATEPVEVVGDEVPIPTWRGRIKANMRAAYELGREDEFDEVIAWVEENFQRGAIISQNIRDGLRPTDELS